MAEFHERMRDWIENAEEMFCGLAPECRWAITTSGIDTKGDVVDAYRQHLSRHDAELSRELDAL